MSVSTFTAALAAVAMLMPSISPYAIEVTESSSTVSTEQKSDSLALTFSPFVCNFFPNLPGCEKYRAH